MEPEDIMLSKIRKAQKDNTTLSFYMWGVKVYTIEVQSRMVVTRERMVDGHGASREEE